MARSQLPMNAQPGGERPAERSSLTRPPATTARCGSASAPLAVSAGGSACGTANRSPYERCGTQVTVARAIDAPDTKLLVHALALSTAVENKIGRFVDGIGSAIKAKALAAIGDSQQPASKDRFAAWEDVGHVLVAPPIQAGTFTTTYVRGRGLCRWFGRADRAGPCPHLTGRSRRSARFRGFARGGSTWG